MTTVLHRLSQWAKETPDAIAQKYKAGGSWHEITARQFCDHVYHLAVYLDSHGVTADQAGAILAYNSPEWVTTDLAVLLLGAKSAGLYPNSNAKDIDYVLNHTEATVISVQNKEYFSKIPALPERTKILLVFDGDTSVHPKAVAYQAALEEGRKLVLAGKAKTEEELLGALDPKAGAFMIYTSGTTGNPKGALLSHENMVYTSDLAASYWKMPYAKGSTFSFLPLCHIAEKLQCIGVGISQRYTVNFATKFENVAPELAEVQPTLLLCVPRLWEKMMEGVLHKVKNGKGAKKKLAEWALATGARVAAARYSGGIANPLDLIQLKLGDKLVLSKVRQALGLSKVEILASGAAPLPAHVSKWFRSLGLEILEDYGQTESTGVICMTLPGKECSGTVGMPVPGLEFKLAEDGEIMTRGKHVFVGYYKNDEATASTLTDGWLHTGDLGEWTQNHTGLKLIRIIGRKKEIMKSSGGKMVAPLPIEEEIKVHEIISQVCMVGDNRKYFSALITLTEPVIAELSKKPSAANAQGVVTDAEILRKVELQVKHVNSTRASYEQIKRFTVLSREFSIVEGEMTPTLKMKRAVIETRFKDLIDAMYSGSNAGE